MQYDDFMRICDTATATIPATNLSEARTLHTSNYLIGAWWSRGYLYSDAHGIKTGSTSSGGALPGLLRYPGQRASSA